MCMVKKLVYRQFIWLETILQAAEYNASQARALYHLDMWTQAHDWVASWSPFLS